MMVRPNTLIRIAQVLSAGILIVAILFLASFLPTATESNRVEAKQMNASTNALAKDMSRSPNVVTSSAGTAVGEFGQTMDTMAFAINSGVQSAAATLAQSSKTALRGIQTGAAVAARGLGSGVSFVGRVIGSGVSFVIRAPGNVLGFVSAAPGVRDFIRPAEHAEVPIIDPDSPELLAALEALPATEKKKGKASKNISGPQWPMRGRVTADFGVPHWPYQHTHSGIDITDDRGVGNTPIKPFRSGRVIDTVYSSYGFGNHVIVDHGSGVTSVYAHLHTISVRVGQKVDFKTVLGTEGTTGLSTGPHLHFEIRVNGKAANPRQFINGQP